MGGDEKKNSVMSRGIIMDFLFFPEGSEKVAGSGMTLDLAYLDSTATVIRP